MSRYTQYDAKALHILEAARIHALVSGSPECRPLDLVAGVFEGLPDIGGPAEANSVPPHLRLSAEVRAVLNRAEEQSPGNVQDLDLLRAMADVCREELAQYFADSRRTALGGSPAKTAPSDLETQLRSAIVGQDHAIRAISAVIRLRELGLDLRASRPAGVFLFSGPTGVGKTELAIALAEAMTGRRDRLLRLDCSEYSESHQVARLLGAPPSYVGYGTPSPLEDFVARGKAGVILLDEFEKADVAFHRMFLQVFDAGRLTSSAGKLLDLSGMVFIATANILPRRKGRTLDSAIGTHRRDPDAPSAPMEEFKRVFAMEMLNRFDEIIMFRPLSAGMALRILRDHTLPAVNASLQRRHGVSIELTDEAEALVIERGSSAEFGARNLHRAFASLVLKPLADWLSAPCAPSGTVSVGVRKGEIVLGPALGKEETSL